MQKKYGNQVKYREHADSTIENDRRSLGGVDNNGRETGWPSREMFIYVPISVSVELVIGVAALGTIRRRAHSFRRTGRPGRAESSGHELDRTKPAQSHASATRSSYRLTQPDRPATQF